MSFKNRFEEKSLLFIVAISIILVLSSCNTDDDPGEYYQGTFNDSVAIINEADTTNIILEQARTQFHKENVPYSIEINDNTDAIVLKLFVSYGSYNQNPNPVKDIDEISDTFYVWYSLRNKSGKTLPKNNSITEVNTSPAISYVSIDSVVVQKATSKVVNFISRLIE
jgi:hypothetical protein